MTVGATSEVIFLDKRQRLIQQIYLENEYKKRNFLINNDIRKSKDVIAVLEKHAVYADKDNFRVELEDTIRKIKWIGCDITSLCDAGSIEEKILETEMFSRKEYGIPFYNLMMPDDIREKLEKIKLYSNYLPNPIIPSFADKNKFLDTIFYNTILSYSHSQKAVEYLLDEEKEYLRSQFEKIMDSSSADHDIALLTALFKCANGHKLKDIGFSVLSEKMDSYLLDDVRNNSFVTRLHGILYFDFVLSLAAVGQNYKADHFISYFSNILGEDSKKRYPEKIKRKYRDALKITAQCIQANKILPISNTGAKPNIPKVNLPEHVPFFDEYKE